MIQPILTQSAFYADPDFPANISSDDMELISQIKQMFVNYGVHTEIIVTSIRNPTHVPETV